MSGPGSIFWYFRNLTTCSLCGLDSSGKETFPFPGQTSKRASSRVPSGDAPPEIVATGSPIPRMLGPARCSAAAPTRPWYMSYHGRMEPSPAVWHLIQCWALGLLVASENYGVVFVAARLLHDNDCHWIWLRGTGRDAGNEPEGIHTSYIYRILYSQWWLLSLVTPPRPFCRSICNKCKKPRGPPSITLHRNQ